MNRHTCKACCGPVEEKLLMLTIQNTDDLCSNFTLRFAKTSFYKAPLHFRGKYYIFSTQHLFDSYLTATVRGQIRDLHTKHTATSN